MNIEFNFQLRLSRKFNVETAKLKVCLLRHFFVIVNWVRLQRNTASFRDSNVRSWQFCCFCTMYSYVFPNLLHLLAINYQSLQSFMFFTKKKHVRKKTCRTPLENNWLASILLFPKCPCNCYNYWIISQAQLCNISKGGGIWKLRQGLKRTWNTFVYEK